MPKSKKTVNSAASSPAEKESQIDVTPEERRRMIAEAAYFHAEQRGFQGGDEAQDWFEAEQEVDRLLARQAPAEAQPSPH